MLVNEAGHDGARGGCGGGVSIVGTDGVVAINGGETGFVGRGVGCGVGKWRRRWCFYSTVGLSVLVPVWSLLQFLCMAVVGFGGGSAGDGGGSTAAVRVSRLYFLGPRDSDLKNDWYDLTGRLGRGSGSRTCAVMLRVS